MTNLFDLTSVPVYADYENATLFTDYESVLKATLAWVERFTARTGKPPSILQVHLGLDISYAAARRRVGAIERLGWIPARGIK